MTAIAPAAPETAAAPDSAGKVARRRWRKSRGVLIAVFALMIVGVVLAALRPATHIDYLDPDSPGSQGTRALAEITRQHGTPVNVVRNVSAAVNQMQVQTDSTLVITQSERLDSADLSRLSSLPGDRLLIEPSTRALDALAPGVTPQNTAYGTLPPDCALPAAANAGEVNFSGSMTYETPPGATGCYFFNGKPDLVQLSLNGSSVTVLGSGIGLTNQNLADGGNAALGMNLLGTRSNVVWLMPDLPPPGSGDKSFGDLVPFGVKLALLQVVIAVVLVALWRARRLGPVVVEPLPVVVRSAEAVEGRARLYRALGATDRAALSLRAGALERLTGLLGMPKSAATDPARADEIVNGIAAHTGQQPAVIGSALYGPPPMNDAELVRLAGYLDELERQVRNS